MELTTGGTLTAVDGYVGGSTGSDGTFLIDGSSSQALFSGQLRIGLDGTGRTTISNGGTVIADSTVVGYGVGSGVLNVTDGTLETSSLTHSGSGGAQVNFDAGTLHATADSGSFISGFTGTQLNIDSGGLTIDSNGFDVAASAPLTGAGGVKKIGDGTLTLSGANTYAGGTEITAGIVSVSADANLGDAAGGVTIDGGALQFSTSFNTARDVELGNGNGTIDTMGNSNTLSGTLSGPGALTKIGSGTLTLTGNNGYAGGTEIKEGILNVSADTNLGAAGAGVSIDGGTLQFGASFDSARSVTLGSGNGTIDTMGNTNTLSGVVSGPGALTKIGSGTLTLSGNNAYKGGTEIKEGVLNVSSDGNLGDASGEVAINGGTLQFGASFDSARAVTLGTGNGTIDTMANNNTLSGIISGPGGLTKIGSGTLTLAGNNSYEGGTSVNDGVLQIGDGGTSGSITGDVAVANGAALKVDRSDQVTLDNVISGDGKFAQSGSGTTTLSGNNSYAGGTEINAGVLQVSSDGNLGGSSGGISIDGGTLQFGGGFDTARGVTLGSGNGTIDTMGNTNTLSGVVSGPGALTKIGSGTLVLAGNNAYQGGTEIKEGVLKVSSDASLGDASGGVSIDGGTLQFGSSFDSGRAVTLGANDGTIDTMGNTNRLSGAISGEGGLTKAGDGTLVLAGDNSYAGGTTIAAGVLQVGDGGTSGSITGDVTVAGGAELKVDRSDEVTLAGSIAGDGRFVQAGSGTTVLSGINTHKGGTDITGGVLQVSSDANLGDAAGPLLIDGGVLRYGASFDSVRDMTLGENNGTIDTMENTNRLAGVISGDGGLTKAGDGTLILTGNNSYKGSTAVTAGILQIGDGGTSGSIVGDVALAEGTELIIRRADDVTLPGAVSGAGSLTQAGSGTTTLTGPATHTGDTDIEDGALRLAGNGSLETSDRVKADATFDISGIGGSQTTIQSLAGKETGRVTLGGKDLIIANGKDAFAGIIEGDGGLTINGGHQTLTGDNTYKGGTLIGDDGTLEIGDGGTSGSVGDPIENRGVLIYNLSGEYRINQITGDGALVQTGGGTGLIDSKQGYTSRTIIDAGNALKLVGDGDISASSGVTANGAFDISGLNADMTSIKGLSGGPDGRVHLGAKDLAITAAENDDFQGIIDGTGGLSVTGGRQILSGDNEYTGGTYIARGAALQLGNGGTSGSVRGGITIDGLLAFNRSDTFTADNPLSGAGIIEQIGSGTTILAGDNSGFSGTTNIRAGALAVNGRLCGPMNVLAGGRLQGTGTVCDTTNAGTVAPGNSFGTLTVDGNYVGNGGTLEIETALGGDGNTQTDMLVVTGDTSGQTYVRVINRGGLGARTNQGIKIVDIEGQSDGTFTLIGDYTTRKGESAVIGGAYAYTLDKNGIATPGDGDWYLRSQYAPQPGAPLYEAYTQVLNRLNRMATLAERTGNRYWTGAAYRPAAQGEGSGEGFGEASGGFGSGPALTEAGLIWSRIEAAHGRHHLDQSLTDAEYEINSWKLEAGADGQFYENARGRLIGSAWVSYGTATADIASYYGHGSMEVGGTGFGAALTWYDDAGYYLDGKAQITWFDSDLNSATLRRGLADGHNSLGYAMSLESGQRIAISEHWLLTPQAQLTYATLDLDGFSDPYGARVGYDRPDSLTARIGLAANYQSAWQDAMGFTRQADLYGIASLTREFLGRNKWTVSGERFTTTEEKVWAEIGAGGTYNWNDGRYGMYAKLAAQTNLDDFANSYALSGNLAFRVKW
ncbi:autotransporter-associated beta strand repeat-containing protein [Mesorhizobium sp. RMAD-H1]|uniref:autotransporter-associated beta strand repeat-containing protein n=1 Tax=Mesorhizobium sp. RMAD-H1 TaxID=2587065 RepID=UPI001608FA64|nr:autotransporter-associated beta strand repeat-containing protein [Mesorhizobium sp. RMAD-H1]MBB2969803.1 fibronectin-binding autotransporter adhesin [Mesorhizobium sp. RMAD-H1]